LSEPPAVAGGPLSRAKHERPFIALLLIFLLVYQPAIFSTPLRPGNDANGSPTNSSQPISQNILDPTDAVITRHHPNLNSGTIEGTLRILQGEPFSLNGNTQITSDIFLPGTPAIQLQGAATHGGIIVDEGSAVPANYPITLSGAVNLPGKIHTNVDPLPLPAGFPSSIPTPNGARNVTIRTESDIAAIVDWQTVRDLNIKGSRLTLDVPPGNYGAFTVNGNSRLNFSAGTYNFANTFNLDGSASIQTTGVVTINVGQNLTINSGAIVPGSYTSPGDVRLNVLGPTLNINGSSQVAGLIRAYHANVTINGTASVRGQIIADTFTLNGGKVSGAVWPARSGNNLTMFGPRHFDRTTGAPNQYLEQFSLPAGVPGPYTIHIQNGGADATNRVSSATVKLNGAEVLSPSDFNQNVTNIDRAVFLGTTNSVEVRLASNPGSYLIISISAVTSASDVTAPSLSIVTPDDDTTTSNGAITISGTATDSGAPTGAASGVAHVFVNETEAAYNAANSTWTIADLPLAIGDNVITVRAVDQAGNQATATITITRSAPNSPPTVDAGPDQTFSLPHDVALHGTASDDGLPEGSSLKTKWIVVSNPGTVTFANVESLNSMATFETAGTYVLRLTVTDGALSASDDVTLTVLPVNQPPIVNAGPNQTIALPRSATLAGAATDDGLPVDSVLTTSWTQVSGPGLVAFEDSTHLETTANFSQAGTYVLRLSSNDCELTASSDVTIIVRPENQAPKASAGPDQVVVLPTTVQLNGSMSDDGWPESATLSATWSIISGPGPATFQSPNMTVTTAVFTQPGAYQFRLTVTDGELSSSDDIQIIALPENHAPTVNAGPDQTLTVFTAANLNGVVSDDGYPSGSSVTSTWTKLTGPGTVSFASSNAPSTTANFSLPGVYVLRLTASDSVLSSDDDATITVTDPRQPPVADFVVPESTGVAGAFVISSSGSTSPNFSPEKLLDSDSLTSWTTAGLNNQFARMQFFDQQMVWIDRVRLQAANGAVSNATVKNFEVQISATTADDANFVTALRATLLNTGQLQEFVFPGGPSRAHYIRLIPQTNYGDPNSFKLGTFNPVAVGSADRLISLPGQGNVALCQSPALAANGGAIYNASYPGGDSSANGLLGYFVGGWQTTTPTNQFATIQLAGGQSHTIEGVRLATWFDSGHGLPTAVQDFEVWVSNTTPDDFSFTRVLSATAAFVPYAQRFIFPGGPVEARYVKYVPLTNGGAASIHTQAFDVIAARTARVVAVSAESPSFPNSAQAAFDGLTTTNWIATGTLTNVWLTTSLANEANQQIYGVRILPMSDLSNLFGPKDFAVRVSTTTTDDSAFTTIYSGTVAPIFNSPVQEFLFGSFVEARYVQFVWKNSYSSSLVGVKELEVLAAPDRGSAVIAFSSQDSAAETAANALDLDPIDKPWVTANNQNTNQWLKLLLPRAGIWTIDHIALRPGPSASDPNRSPKDFELQVSTTDAADASFTTAFAGTLANSAQLQDFYFPATNARYVRLLLKNNYGSSQIGLSSFYVYSRDEIGTTVRFIDRSTDADGQIVAWNWNFGDGESSSERHPVHTFQQSGDYTVSLTVTDDSGVISTRQALYHVQPSLQADFAYSPIVAHEGGEAVRFTDLTGLLTRPTAIRQYDFGDGSTLAQGAISGLHTFQDSGTFQVRLKIGDPLGTNYVVTKDVVVLNMPPSVDIDPGKNLVWGQPWTSVPRITDQSPIDNASLQGQWNFADGQTAQCMNCTEANATVVHTYSAPGTYNAVLTVTDKDGGAGTDNAVFAVSKRPTSFVVQNPPSQTTGTALVLHGELRDTYANQPLAGKQIQFVLNGARLDVVTAANGIAEVNVPLPAGTKIDLVSGSFAGDDLYLSSSGVGVPPVAGNSLSETATHQGTNFWLMFPNAFFTGGLPTQRLSITSAVATTGVVAVPGMNFTQAFSVPANGATTVTLPFVQVTDAEVIQPKGIHVTSQQPVAVYGLSQRAVSTDAFLAIPFASLGTDYRVLTYSNMPFAPSSEFGIVAAENATTVTIIPSATTGTHIAGVPYSLTLNQGETYLLQNTVPTVAGDLSGSRVTSNKPIAVFGGHMSATIPAEAGCCADHLLEQLPPTNSWGKRFATTPLATRTRGDYFRFLAAEDGTAVYLNGSLMTTLNGGEFAERVLQTPGEIIATKPILVAQYGTSIFFDNGTTGKADPFMMIVPPYSQFLKHYVIATPATGFQINYANIVAPTALLGSITLDGAPVAAASFTQIGVSGFSGAQVPITVGSHTVLGPAAFGVSVYGFAQDESYGYPGGMNLTPSFTGASLNVTPEVSAPTINTEVCLTATADQAQVPLGGKAINFTVTGINSSNLSSITDAAGQARFCYTGAKAGTDQVTVTVDGVTSSASVVWSPPNQAPAVNAGTDQIITLPAFATLQGTATDDGLPANTLNVSWTRVSGPGSVAFANASAATTSVAFDSAGTYVLRLTASDTSQSVSDDVEITVNAAPINKTPTVTAGADQQATLHRNMVRNPGNEETLVAGRIPQWTAVEGLGWTQGLANGADLTAQRGAAYFFAGDAGQAELRQDVDVSAFAAAISAGTQQFEFQAYLRSAAEAMPDTGHVVVEYRDQSNSNLLAALDSGAIAATNGWHLTEDIRTAPAGTGWIRIRLLATRNSGATNDAFFDSISLRPVGATGLNLAGTADDDGLPSSGSLLSNWSVVSGPGPVNFSDPHNAASGATFSTPGSYVLRLTATDGLLSTSDDVTIIIDPANNPPVISAGPDQSITLPAGAILDGAASDDGATAGNGLSVLWSKVIGPGIVTLNNPTEAKATATFSAPGLYLLRLTADDGEYAATSEVQITVNPVPVNQPPTVSAGSDQTTSLPSAAISLNGAAGDDGLPLGSALSVGWSLISGPGAAAFTNPNSAITSVQFSAAGNYLLRLTASDGVLSASDDMVINVTAANETPIASAGVDRKVLLSQGALLNGSVSDDGLPGGNLTTAWSMINGPGTVNFANPNTTVTTATFSATGTYVLRLTVSDGQLSASDDVSVTIDDNVPLPTVAINSPADGAELTAPAIVNGSVSNGAWVLEYSLNSEDGAANQTWRQIASGNSAIANESLGSLDTTLMLNGIYSLRLRATDDYGQTSYTSISVLIDKNLKVGHFQIAFSDLSVPLAGLPIEVVRSYDSRDSRTGDFGVGWQLGIKSARVEKTGVLGFSWLQTVTSGAFPTYCLEPSRPHKVAITFGDGKVFKFQAATALHCRQLAPITATQLTFTPEPGTHAVLEAVGPTDVLVETLGSLPGPVRLINQNNPDIFNSATFRLTTAEGAVYVIDQRTGVSSVRDPHGNTLTIGRDGIIHSSGRSVTFTRDLTNRITQISDPNGNSQSYSYDSHGDLASFTDRENQTTTYTYDSDHRLLTITDAQGITALQNQFDAQGRLIGQRDAFQHVLGYDHDFAGRVETITDRLGHATRFENDERGNVLRRIDHKGGTRSFTYDELDNLLSETNELGRTTTYTYDEADNRTSVTDPLGNVTQFTYNGARQLLTVTDPLTHVTTNTYDEAGTNLLTSRGPGDNTTTYTYSVFTGQRTSMKDALDHETFYAYDANGRLSHETDALGHVTTYAYDPNGNRTSQTVMRTNALGQLETITTSYEYDKLNRPVKTTYADGSFTRIEYNLLGQQSAIIDQLGARTEFTYDEMGRLTRTDYADGAHEETAYEAEGRRLTSKDRAGHLTSYSYDELGRLISTGYADGTSTATTYDAAGQVLTTKDARGNITQYFYDAVGRRQKVRNALGQETTFTYNANGNRLSVTDALGHPTRYEYDAEDRRTKTIYADDSFDSVGYDVLGRTVSKTDQAGKTTSFAYDALGRLTKVTDALNLETLYTYDELGRQLTQTDANNHTTRFEYDQLGRRVKRILPLGQSETYAYDLAGNLVGRTDFNGKTTSFTYDPMKRLLLKAPDPSLNQPAVSFTYNSNGQRTKMTDASGITVYTYDLRNRLAGKQTPFGTLNYSYDAAGNLASTRSSNTNGASIDYSYDALNRLAAVQDNRLASLNEGETNYTYDGSGNLLAYTYPNQVTTSYGYDSLNRLRTMTVGTSASSLAGYSYTLGPAGNRTAVTELSGRTVNYTYDDLYRLTVETISHDSHGSNGAISYAYDAVGNRLARTSNVSPLTSQGSTYDANDRLTSDTYDHNGNTTLAGGNTYAYDFENHLTSLIAHDSSLITFTYDGDGNRVSKTAGGISTNYLIDTNNPTGYAQVVEELQSGAVTRSYTYGHDLISQRCPTPGANCSLSFYGYDGHGNVRVLTDAAGTVTDTYDYDAFGNLISRTGTTANDYLYTGEQFDANLGFYYLRARYMNPAAGRFWSMDPFEGGSYDPSSLHKYLYARNNPANLIDPSGHSSFAQMVNTSTLLGTISGFGLGLIKGGIKGAIVGAVTGAALGAAVSITGGGVGYFLLGNAARGVFITGWGATLGSAGVSGYSLTTATSEEERQDAGIDLLATAAFMFVGPKILESMNTRIISGQQANECFCQLRPGFVEQPWVPSDNLTETTLFTPGKLVRVYTEGQTDPIGYWLMAESEIAGLTPAQIQQKFALPFTPTHIATIGIPAGTTLRIGPAAPNAFGSGGGMQVEIQRPNFPNAPNPPPKLGPCNPF